MTKKRLQRLLALSGGTAAAGGLALLNKRLEQRGGRAAGWLGGEQRYYRWRGGRLAYSVAGDPDAEPLLLLHGIYAGASSLEFRKNFGELSKGFRVYALDLLGCGDSDKPRRRYGTEDVTSQVEDFVREEIGARTHLVASSLSAALCTPATVRSPRLFGKLVLICPTGFGTLDRPSGTLGDLIYTLFLAPVVGTTLYHGLVSRAGIRYYLERMAYHDPALVTEDLIDGYYKAGHGPGARYLPAAFVAGKLNLGVAKYFPRVPQRTLICWGKEAKTAPVEEVEDFVNRNPRAEPLIFRDAALLPHDERAEDFNKEVRGFLEVAGPRSRR